MWALTWLEIAASVRSVTETLCIGSWPQSKSLRNRIQKSSIQYFLPVWSRYPIINVKDRPFGRERDCQEKLATFYHNHRRISRLFEFGRRNVQRRMQLNKLGFESSSCSRRKAECHQFHSWTQSGWNQVTSDCYHESPVFLQPWGRPRTDTKDESRLTSDEK